MDKIALLVTAALLAGCSAGAPRSGPAPSVDPDAGPAAMAACRSALALRTGTNAIYVLPLSHASIGAGQEVFLSLHQAQWLCMTDARGNVNRLEKR